MDYGLIGMRVDRSQKKELTRKEEKMDYGFFGTRMDKRWEKELTRMGS